MKIRNFLSILFLLVLSCVVYRVILTSFPISGGDYISYSSGLLQFFHNNPFAIWDPTLNLGNSIIPFMHYAPYNFLLGFMGFLSQYNTVVVERIVWWIPFLLLSVFSTITLYRFVCSKKVFWFISPIIFLCNTYILLIIAGGQIGGIGLAYALAPLVFYGFMKVIVASFSDKSIKSILRYSLLAGLLFSFDIVLDLRSSYITLLGIGLYWIFFIFSIGRSSLKKYFFSFFFVFIIPALLTGLLHAFWLLPLVLFRINPTSQFGAAYTGTNSLSFFSFATFENAFGLLHPNWPSNIFGKVSFMKPEFLLLPILAFASFLFVRKNKEEANNTTREQFNNSSIIYFACLGLIGIFLAKGTNDPFGFVYTFLFQHISGFIMFRDPTKWYLLIAISYSVLIPFTLENIVERMTNLKLPIINFQLPIKKLYILCCLSLLFIIYFLFLSRQALFGQLTGTFRSQPVPHDYFSLNNKITSDNHFYRTLWIPVTQRYAAFSVNHPLVSGEDFFHTSSVSATLQVLQKPETQQLIQDSAINYIIVPADTEKEIFLSHQQYDQKLYEKTIKTLTQLPWISSVQYYGKIAVFTVKSPKDRFWINDPSMQLQYQVNSSVEYTVHISHAKKNDKLIFSEAYNPYWYASVNNTSKLASEEYENRFNSFMLPENGDYTITIYYQPQEIVTIGLWVSAICLIASVVYLFCFKNNP